MSNSTSSAINAARIKYGCKPTGTSFPCMIYQCLQDIQVLGERDETLRHLGKIISWQTHGRAFKIHNRKNFIELVMPIWFPKIKYSSFTRQCCLYGFTRIQDKGEDYNALFHQLFVRGEYDLVASMQKTPKRKCNIARTSSLTMEHRLNCEHEKEIHGESRTSVAECTKMPDGDVTTSSHVKATASSILLPSLVTEIKENWRQEAMPSPSSSFDFFSNDANNDLPTSICSHGHSFAKEMWNDVENQHQQTSREPDSLFNSLLSFLEDSWISSEAFSNIDGFSQQALPLDFEPLNVFPSNC